MPISIQYGLTFVRNDTNLLQPTWNNPNGPTWIKRMLPNGGNNISGNIGITGKRFEKTRLSRLNLT